MMQKAGRPTQGERMLKLLYTCLLLFVLCSATAQEVIPEDLSTSKVVIIRRHFAGWERTLGDIPPGFTYDERKELYEEYLENIDAVDRYFKAKKIDYKVLMGRNGTGDYIIDHKMECEGDDWIGGGWICNGGLYFVHRESEKEYAPLGFDKFFRTLKKKMK